MKLEGFNTIDFGTSREGVVYVFFVATETEEIPFYVGETDRFQGRMDDYVRAQFAAPTDFKVGEAVRYLRDAKNYRVIVKYKVTANRSTEEARIIQGLHSEGKRLLNDLPDYEYRTGSKEERAEKISRAQEIVQRFCDSLTGKQLDPASA